MQKFPKVGIVYLSYHSGPYLERFVESLKKSTYSNQQTELIIVDNPHPQFGSSVNFINEKVLPFSNDNFPNVTILSQTKNIGVAAGYNAGIRRALALNCEYVLVHNQDGFMAPDCVEKLVNAMASDDQIGCAQPLVLLYPEQNLINTSGNAYHYLGFGYSNNYRRPAAELQFKPAEDIGYASGALLILRADLLKKYGLFDEDLISYHEDLEYSLRLKSVGYRAVAISGAKFFHQYQFSRNQDKYYLMERNRLAVLVMYYRWPTLFLLLPIGIIMEVGLHLSALASGWLVEKLRADRGWLSPVVWLFWLKKRAIIQRHRTVTDGALLKQASGKVVFADANFKSPLLRYIGNPILAGYWQLVKRLIVW